MSGSSKKEDINAKKKYVFFCDPDVIVQRAEASAQQDYITNQIFKDKPSNFPIEFDLKNLEKLSYQPIQPYPFTFISAVKRKLILNDGSEVYIKTQESNNKNAIKPSRIIKSDSTQNLHEVIHKMDFIRPLKVPDLKISAKKLDFSNRENCTSKESVSPKFETPSKEFIHERGEKKTRNFERVQRRLDFSTSDVSSTITSEIEPLKVPNISISSNLSKKKEYVRENSREKENRKRIRKDESLFSKQDETQDFYRRSRSPRYTSRKDFSNNMSENIVSKLKNDRFHMPRESDFIPSKSKTKNFATSTAKKVNDKKHKSFNTKSLKSRDTSLESKNRSYSNESLSERSSKLSDKVTIRESRNIFENFDYKHKDDLHMLKQMDDQKYIFSSENRQVKQHKITCQSQGKTGNIFFKEQNKKSEKIKPSTSKMDGKMYVVNSKESEGIESITNSNISVRTQSPSTISIQQMKNKDSEKTAQGINICKLNKITEDSKYTDDSLTQCTNVNIKKEEESFTQIATTDKQTSNSNESNLSDNILSSALFDPKRISFRDENRLQQEEFCDLVTPDMNLIPRSKRKRQFIQNNNIEADLKCSKHNMGKIETESENMLLLHPTALHMQFQAELHLLDSFNESLRQVMDVEKCLYNVRQDQEKEISLQHSQPNNQIKPHFSKAMDERDIDDIKHCNDSNKAHKLVATDNAFPANMVHHITSQTIGNEFDNINKITKPVAVEVQTQTVNDMATQTDIRSTRRNVQSRCSEICGTPYERGFIGDSEVPHFSLDSVEQFEDLDQIEEISLPSKLRTMSEISLHETTSSIRTETGTEISISTRDVTCSFNKYLDLEIAQLIKDEKQRYDKIEMLFKSREKTLNDRTKKLVKLEEQKRALRDTGQDSRVSSVKKKQRALLLKLQQEKDEMNRLKELHKIASQERKLMLQKQRNMFNPQISTKNILTKLKRSADSQSPRRLSGPMKGYDIRSNSSMSSLVDSDKSQQHDRSQADARMQMSENELHFSKIDLLKNNKFTNLVEESNASFLKFDKSDKAMQNMPEEKCLYNTQKDGNISKYEIKSRKFEEKMPRADVIRLKSNQYNSIDAKLIPNHSINISGKYLFEKGKSPDVSELLQQNLNKSTSEYIKSESDTLVEELSKKSKPSQVIDNHFQILVSPRESLKAISTNSEILSEEISSVSQDTVLKTSKSSQVSEDILQMYSKSSKRSSKSIPTDMSKKTQYSSESKSNFKRKSSKCQKSKSSSSILTENILRSKSHSQMSEEFVKHHNKRTRMEKEFVQFDKNDENALIDKHTKDKNLKLLTDRIDDYDAKENVFCQKIFDKNVDIYGNSCCSQDKNEHNFDEAKSQIGNFAISHHSSGESDRNYSKSVVIRSQDHNLKTSKKLEQILNAREAALTSRKNCVEEWMAWHAKLRTEEDRVARMEQAALKLVTATSNVFLQDTTVSSDTSDIEGRIELLTEKLAERRIEMSRLKREARKQTKQKLRALEANLLNQIKKYDTTIYEMRKKLESRKGASKDSEKLAIESRSLADFKIPEIPLKKLQDIFKNNDLLRSRSESDLLSTKKLSIKDPMKNINILQNEIIEARYEKNHSERMTKSLRNIRTLEQLSSAKSSMINHSSQSVFDESISEQIEIDKLGSASMSSVSDGARSEKNIPCGTEQYINEIQNKQSISDVKKSSISEDVKTEINTPKSESDIHTQSEVKFSKYDTTIQSDLKEYKSDFDTFSEQSRVKTISSQSKINKSQHSEHLEHILSEKSNNIQHSNAEINTESVNESLDFSKKLDFLRLNNQNLNEDISSLENELKILSEMMSRFNKKSIEEKKYELQNEEKSTSKDISEIHSISDKINEVYDVEIIKEDKIKNVELHSKESNSDIPQYLTNNTRLLSPTNFSDSNSIVEEVDNVISVIMPQSKMSSSKSSSQEIDYKARSKKILNEIEKSIISEHIKVPKDDRSEISENKNLSLHKRNEEISNDTSANVKSLSEIYSKSIQDKNRCINILEFETTYPEKNIEENLTDLHNVESYQSLKSKKSSSLSSESFEDNEKDKSLNQNTDINLSSIINDISSTEIHLENKNNSTLKEVQDVSKQATVTEYVNELLKRQLSPQLSNSMKTIDTSKESIDYVKDIINDNMSYQNINDIHLVSKTKNLELLLKESKELTNNNKNETVFTQTEEMIEPQEVSQKSIKSSKQDISDYDLNMSKKEIIENNNQSEIFLNKTFNKNDWTISNSFDVISAWEKSQSQTSKSFNDLSTLNSKNISQSVNYKDEICKNEIINDIENDVEEDIEDVSSFIPKSESTNIEIHEIKFDETLDYHFEKFGNKSKDVMHVVSKNNDIEENENSIETNDFQKIIYDSVTKILDKVEKSIENNTIREKTENHTDMDNIKNKNEIQIEEREKSISSNVTLSNNLEENLEKNKMKFNNINEEISLLNFSNDKNINEEITINENTEIIKTNVEIKNDENMYCTESKSREIIITELEPENIENESLSELDIDAKIELAEEEFIETDRNKEEIVSQEQKFLETIIEQDSSDGEQLDNLVEVTEGVLDVIEKGIKCSTDSIELKSISSYKINDHDIEIQDNKIQSEENPAIVNDIKTIEHVEVDTSNVSLNVMMNKTFDIVKDPEYEDISEESLEVSEIFDKSELQKSTIVQKSSIPEKYEAIQKSEKVLKILDEITQKPLLNSENDINKFQDNEYLSENNKELQISDKISIKNNQSLSEKIENQKSEKIILEKENQLIENVTNMNEMKKKKEEQDVLSESSEDRDTPKGVSEIDMDSPRDLNDSRLDIDVLNDDLLSNPNIENQNIDSKNTFHATPIVATSEKDIEVMIDKLKASLEQPGMEVADWEAKLLRIEQLQIELEIKKLEAEEESYYVRKIPNKPPPPYTPPTGSARISTSLGSPSPPPAVIPSNIEELVAFTEKATAIIFKAKEAGEDIMNLKAPSEICELTKENDETMKKDRRIYNTFLFDLCKETIAEVYQAEYEKPGPSWTKPNVKTKPIVKIPKTIQELNAYVNKEVATLFGFKTKLQRENMVMRWSRKRRDRVDELLAREAQAEEDEWTKFHHDELAVKNGLTVTILDTLLMETVNVVKVAYAKKRKVMI